MGPLSGTISRVGMSGLWGQYWLPMIYCSTVLHWHILWSKPITGKGIS